MRGKRANKAIAVFLDLSEVFSLHIYSMLLISEEILYCRTLSCSLYSTWKQTWNLCLLNMDRKKWRNYSSTLGDSTQEPLNWEFPLHNLDDTVKNHFMKGITSRGRNNWDIHCLYTTKTPKTGKKKIPLLLTRHYSL